jgi:sulfur carrier protein
MPDTSTNPIEIFVNGESRLVPPELTVSGLLGALGLDPSRVAIELDRAIVRRPDWGRTVVGAGARLEIVQFVGGG